MKLLPSISLPKMPSFRRNTPAKKQAAKTPAKAKNKERSVRFLIFSTYGQTLLAVNGIGYLLQSISFFASFGFILTFFSRFAASGISPYLMAVSSLVFLLLATRLFTLETFKTGQALLMEDEKGKRLLAGKPRVLQRTRIRLTVLAVLAIFGFAIETKLTMDGLGEYSVQKTVESPEYLTEDLSYYDQQITRKNDEIGRIQNDIDNIRSLSIHPERNWKGNTPAEERQIEQYQKRIDRLGSDINTLNSQRRMEIDRIREENKKRKTTHKLKVEQANTAGLTVGGFLQAIEFMIFLCGHLLKARRPVTLLENGGYDIDFIRSETTRTREVGKNEGASNLTFNHQQGKIIHMNGAPQVVRKQQPPEIEEDATDPVANFWSDNEKYQPIAAKLVEMAKAKLEARADFPYSWRELGEKVGTSHAAVKKFFRKYFYPAFEAEPSETKWKQVEPSGTKPEPNRNQVEPKWNQNTEPDEDQSVPVVPPAYKTDLEFFRAHPDFTLCNWEMTSAHADEREPDWQQLAKDTGLPESELKKFYFQEFKNHKRRAP